MTSLLSVRRAPAASSAAVPPRAATLGVAAAALLLWPAPLPGQEGGGAEREPDGPRRLTVEAAVFGGVLSPLGRLTTDPETFETEVSASGLLGAEVTGWTGGRLGLSGQFVWAPAQLSLIPTDFVGALPDELGDATYLAASAEVRYRIAVPPESDLLRPYLALGGGVRRLSVDPIASPEVSDATDPMATAAAGAHVRLGDDLDLRVELRDRLSAYRSPTSGEERLQNDMSITVGLSVILR